MKQSPNHYETLLLDHPADHVLQVTLNRPQSSNAFNTQMAHELIDVFEGLALDAQDFRCIVITGAGDRAFCAGSDRASSQAAAPHPARHC